jgi:lipoprotein NlpD
VFVAVFAFALAGCGSHDTRAAGATYVVRAGDTLYSIAKRHGLDYRDVARWNGIGRDYRITPGQLLVLAPGARRGGAAAPPPRTASGGGPPTVGQGGAVAAEDAIVTPPSLEPPRGTLPWTWPTDGAVAGPVSRPSGGVGLRIDGAEGQEVRAAAPGRVAYVGSGLRAYGQLVIVKHDEAFLTAYGHNATVLVREGDDVRAGEPIATMGLGPANRPMLYFEIRWNGRPVDPRPLLPPR